MNSRLFLVGAFAVASAFAIADASAQGQPVQVAPPMGNQGAATTAPTTNAMPARSNKGGKVRGRARAKQVQGMNAAKRRVKATR